MMGKKKKMVWYRAEDGTIHQVAARPKCGAGVGNNIGILERWSADDARFIVMRYQRAAKTKLYNLAFVSKLARERRALVNAATKE